MKPFAIAAAILIASAALAHQGVKDPAVMARMEAMSGIGKAMKVLGGMAKGETAFDAAAARRAAATIAVEAGRTPALFRTPADDPKSEARPEIWQRFDDFTAKSRLLEQVASGLSTSISTRNDLQTGVKEIGAACKACHKTYRE